MVIIQLHYRKIYNKLWYHKYFYSTILNIYRYFCHHLEIAALNQSNYYLLY